MDCRSSTHLLQLALLYSLVITCIIFPLLLLLCPSLRIRRHGQASCLF